MTGGRRAAVRAALLLAAAAAGTGAAAQPPAREHWVAIFRHSEGGISAYDPASVERDGERVRVRVLWDRSDVAGSPFREGRLHNELDCAAWTGRLPLESRRREINPFAYQIISPDSAPYLSRLILQDRGMHRVFVQHRLAKQHPSSECRVSFGE